MVKNTQKIKRLFSLAGKVALVTGSTRGNGKAIAEGFLDAGATVYFVDMLKKELQETVGGLKNPNAHYVVADITDKHDLEKLTKKVFAQQKGIDILVNNAGISISEPSETYRQENWEKTHAVNVTSVFLLCQLVSKIMIPQKSGAIINVTSLAAERGFPNNPAYVASKGALKQLTKALAMDWGKYNIRVNNLVPGYIKTDMTIKSYNDPILHKERSDKTMLGKWGQPEDLVGSAIFLASDAASYVTGHDLHVDGGWLAKGL